MKDDDSADLWAAGVVAASLVGVAGFGLWAASRRPSVPSLSEGELMPKLQEPDWPIALQDLEAIHESVMAHRKGSGRAHQGVDLMARAGVPVRAAAAGRVLRIIDGSKSSTDRGKAAGLFVDVRSSNGWIYRYLHLGKASVKEGGRVRLGEPIGEVGQAGEASGVYHSRPHLHFEIRTADWDRKRGARGDYGEAIDPLAVLPLRLLPARIKKLIA